MTRFRTNLAVELSEGSDDLVLVTNWLLFDVAPAAPAEMLDWLLGRAQPPAWLELLLDLEDDEITETHLEMFRERTVEAAQLNQGSNGWQVPFVTDNEAAILTEFEAAQAQAGIRIEPDHSPSPPSLDLRPSAEEPGTFAVFSTELAGLWSGWWLGTKPTYRDGIAIRGDQRGAAPDYVRCTPLQNKPTREWHVVVPGGEVVVAGREGRRGPVLALDIGLDSSQTNPGSWRITRRSLAPPMLDITASNAAIRRPELAVDIESLDATITFGPQVTVDMTASVRFHRRRTRLLAPLWKLGRPFAKRPIERYVTDLLSRLTSSEAWPAVVAEAERASSLRG